MDENAIQTATNSHRNDELIGLLIGRSDKLVSEGNVEARSLPKKRVVRPPIHVDDHGFTAKTKFAVLQPRRVSAGSVMI